MKTRADQESRLAAWLHQLSERLTAGRNDIVAAQCQLGRVAHHISRAPTELLERALAQLDQAGEIFLHLRKALDGSSLADNSVDRCFRVCFMNRFARGKNTITACQRSIVISSAESRKVAIEVAKQRFAELEGIPNWQIHASFIEVGRLEEDAAARREANKECAAYRYANLHAPE